MRRLTSRAFVGRAEELGALEAALERAATGTPGAFLVGGEAGVGKTRLVMEFGSRAEAAGARVVAGGCVELSGGVAPLLPVVETLRRVGEQLGWGDWLRLLGDARPELARLLPELGVAAEPPDRALAQSRLFSCCSACCAAWPSALRSSGSSRTRTGRTPRRATFSRSSSATCATSGSCS